jgi:hypothetical protein
LADNDRMYQWKDKRVEFKPDGSLRDIYVYETNHSRWDCFLKHVIYSEYHYEFWHGGSKSTLPNNFLEIKQLQKTEPTLLKIFLQKSIQVNCHFFVEYEVELDVSPSEINGESEFNLLVSFLYWLCRLFNSNVYLTHENSPEQVILNVKPKSV